MVIEVTPVNERIMRQRIRHSLGDISLISVYALSVASDLTVKDAFHAVLESVVDQCPRRDIYSGHLYNQDIPVLYFKLIL